MRTKRTALDILFQEIKESKAFLPDNLFNYLKDVYNKSKEIEKNQEYEIKSFWFGRGILAAKEDKIKELNPNRINTIQ